MSSTQTNNRKQILSSIVYAVYAKKENMFCQYFFLYW